MTIRNARKINVTLSTGQKIIARSMIDAAAIAGTTREKIYGICRNERNEKINGHGFSFYEDDWREKLSPRKYKTKPELMGKRDGSAYTRWRAQRARCSNPNCKAYPTYGALGIQVEYSAQEFISWFREATKDVSESDLFKWDVGRIDHDKNYCLSNIRMELKADNTAERNRRCANPFYGLNDRQVKMTHKKSGNVIIASSAYVASRIAGVAKNLPGRYATLGPPKRACYDKSEYIFEWVTKE